MKFFMTLKKKKLVATESCTGDAATVQLPLPMPLPPGGNHCKSCKKPEGYTLPALALPPVHTINSRLQQPSPRSSELCAATRRTAQLHVELHNVPLSPKMLKVLCADGREEEKIATCLKSQKKSVWTWPCLPTDAEECLRGISPNALVTHFDNPGTAEECSPAEYWSTMLLYDESEWSSSSPTFQFSTSTADVHFMSSIPQRSSQKQGKSFTSPKPCKLPSPPRSPWHPHTNLNQLDNISQGPCPSKSAPALQEYPTRPRLTPPSSQLLLQMNPGLNFETIQHVPRVLNASPPGNASPLYCTSLQAVPRPPQRWKRGEKIGSGSFGCVYEGWNLDDGSFFAVKVSDSDNVLPEIHQEVAVLSGLKHPNIVQYYGTTIENGSICIFLELVKMGSLQSIMKKFRGFDEVLISSYTHQILKGLEYLHAKNTIHRDIKCTNILVDSDGQVKLADFGLAKQMKESLATSVKGSPYYMAPEILLPRKDKRAYGLAVDIWSLGCTVLEMADGKPPWSGLHGGYGFLFKVTNGELPPIPEHLSDKARDFITQCLRTRPEDRPTVNDLLFHPFVAYAPSSVRASVPVHD